MNRAATQVSRAGTVACQEPCRRLPWPRAMIAP